MIMGKFNDVEKVKTAVGKIYKKSLYHRSLSTQGFMELQPYFCRELKPKERIKGQGQIWSRLNTLVNPTFGDCDYHLSKFYVRFKDVWPCWNDFYNRSQHSFGDGSIGYLSERPYFTMLWLFNVLYNLDAIEEVPNPGPMQPDPLYDFVWVDVDENSHLYKWSDDFVSLSSLFHQCGYEFSWFAGDKNHYDALPLFCLAKIFLDHYYPRRYRHSVEYQNIAALFAYNGSLVQVGGDGGNAIYSQGLSKFFEFGTKVYYDNDGVYMAWDNPVGPGADESPNVMVPDTTVNVTEGRQFVVAENDSDEPLGVSPRIHPTTGTPFLGGLLNPASATSAVGVITKNALDMLYKISNMVKRYQLAGNSAAARFLATFGFPLGDTHESIWLGTETVPVTIGDVEANSDSEITVGGEQFTSLLGNLAGKGVAGKSLNFSFNGDTDQGIYFVLCSVIPDASLYQGLDRRLLNTKIEDVVTPVNDSLGVRAISVAEVFTSDNGNYNHDKASKVFGLLPFGWEDVVSRSILSGAFRIKSQGSEELSTYHMFRDMSSIFDAQQTNDPHIGLLFLSGRDSLQYNRIFYNTLASQQFIIRFKMKFDSFSWKRPLYDSYDWNMDEENKQVTIDGNGVEVN